MKRTAVCLTLLAVMTAAGIILLDRTRSVTSDVAERLGRLERISSFAGENALAGSADAIEEEWNGFCSKNIFLTNNECAFEISLTLARLSARIRSGETDISEDCETAGRLIRIYEKSCLPTPENIF